MALGLFSLALYFGDAEGTAPQIRPSNELSGPKAVDIRQLIARCEGGDSEQCLTVGYIYLRGATGDRDFSLAKKYFEKYCDGVTDLNGRGLQCEAIAKIFDDGKEARVDKKVAQFFHEKAKRLVSKFL